MSRLDELIAELCPDGVQYKKLGDIGRVCMCKRIFKEQTNSTGDIPFYKISTFGGVPDSFISKEIYEEYKEKYSFPKKGDILISAAGTIGRTVIYDGEPAYYQDSNIVWVDNDETLILNSFLYYIYSQGNWATSKGGTIARLYNENIRNTIVPIPPLPIQEEIVRILDNFTELTAELTTELTARKKQYEYYRDELLSFGDDVEWKPLGEICELSAGGDVPKESFSITRTDEYSVPIYSNGIGDNALYGYANSAKIFDESVTISARGTIGYCELRKEPYFPIVRLICAVPKSMINADYLKYALETVKFNVPNSGIPQLTVPMVAKYKIPVPTLEIQRNTTKILDKFNSLSNDISIGLPAEIDARQKQYEYYRDKLLDFKVAK